MESRECCSHCGDQSIVRESNELPEGCRSEHIVLEKPNTSARRHLPGCLKFHGISEEEKGKGEIDFFFIGRKLKRFNFLHFTIIKLTCDFNYIFQKSPLATTNLPWRRDCTRRICSTSRCRIEWKIRSSRKRIAPVRLAANEVQNVRAERTLRQPKKIVFSGRRSVAKSRRLAWIWLFVGRPRSIRFTSRAGRRTSTVPRAVQRRRSSP